MCGRVRGPERAIHDRGRGAVEWPREHCWEKTELSPQNQEIQVVGPRFRGTNFDLTLAQNIGNHIREPTFDSAPITRSQISVLRGHFRHRKLLVSG